MKKPVLIPENLWKTMKITFAQLLLVALCSSMTWAHDTHAQEILNRTISVVGERLELKEVLSQIEKQADIKFVYSTKIKSNQRVSLNGSNRRLSTVLDEILKPIAIEYEVIENRILLKKSKMEQQVIPNVEKVRILSPERNDQTITGTVTDENGATLPGVSILVKGTQKGTTTDAGGEYKIDVTNGNAILVFSYVGYEPQEIMVGNKSILNVSLNIDSKSLDEVVVVGYGTQKKRDISSVLDTKEN